MNEEKNDVAALDDIIKRRGLKFVESRIKNSDSRDNVLTIVSNSGVHPIPDGYVFGEIYIASKGNLDFSSIESVNWEFDQIISKLHKKLVEKSWADVYLIPFGHSTLSMNIKLAVYRTLRIETKDVFYFGSHGYGVLERDTRTILVSSGGVE